MAVDLDRAVACWARSEGDILIKSLLHVAKWNKLIVDILLSQDAEALLDLPGTYTEINSSEKTGDSF